MEIQKYFFETLKSRLPVHVRLADQISDLLKISPDSAYRRIRGEKGLSMLELRTLCRHFDISVDSILNLQSDNVIFHRSCLIEGNYINNYFSHIKQVSERFEILASSKTKEIYYIAEDIPFFHVMPFAELMLFKVYVWYQMCSKENISFDKFITYPYQKELSEYHQIIGKSYERVSSNEVWVKNTIDTTLHLLEYYYDLNKFEDKNIAVLLCKQLLQVLENVERWAETEQKGNNNDASFKMHYSLIEPENSLMIIKWDGITSAIINIFIINGMSTHNSFFCMETEKWISGIIEKSLVLSGSAERERFLFFQSMRKKVIDLIGKLEK